MPEEIIIGVSKQTRNEDFHRIACLHIQLKKIFIDQYIIEFTAMYIVRVHITIV